LDIETVVVGLTTKSDKIRALARAGYKRSEIADYLGVRYQHVRNVLVDEERKAGGGSQPARQPGMADPARTFVHKPKNDVCRAVRINVGKGGAVVLPPALLAAMGLADGDVLLARLEDDEIKMMTPETTTRKIQTEMRKYVPEGVSLVDQLIRERREEARREQGDA
jgi:predicted transcriptional regulator